MTQPLLSILIPTVVGRESEFSRLRQSVQDQAKWIILTDQDEVEILFAIDNKQMTICEKREWLYGQASGLYSWQIDDDDTIANDAIWEIFKANIYNPDCITFKEHCTINGSIFRSNHSLKYDDWGEKQDGFDYVRTPFMKSVIKTEIAKSVPVPHLRYSEDHEWARLLKPHLKTEIHIDQELYFYQHNSKPEDHNIRYGIK